MKLVNLVVILFVLFIWPISIATPSFPDQPLFDFGGDGQLKIFNTHSNEILEIEYKDKKGRYLDKGLENIDYMLRCRLTDEMIDIDPKLIALLDNIQDHFGGKRIEIISGYRSPELNNRLRRRKRGVAKRSYHMEGKAVDFRIEGVPTIAVRDYARSLKAGGVGYYARSDFVHIDVGDRVYFW